VLLKKERKKERRHIDVIKIFTYNVTQEKGEKCHVAIAVIFLLIDQFNPFAVLALIIMIQSMVLASGENVITPVRRNFAKLPKNYLKILKKLPMDMKRKMANLPKNKRKNVKKQQVAKKNEKKLAEEIKEGLDLLKKEELKIKKMSQKIPDLMTPPKVVTELTPEDKKKEENVKELKKTSEELVKAVTEGLTASNNDAAIEKVEALVEKGTEITEKILNDAENKKIDMEFTVDGKPKTEKNEEPKKEEFDPLNILINMDIGKISMRSFG
jgi:hypothetical protein